MTRFAPIALLLAFLIPACQSGPAAKAADGAELRVVRLEHTDATEMVTQLNAFLHQHHEVAGNDACRVHAQPKHNAVLIQGSPEEIDQVVMLIANLDK